MKILAAAWLMMVMLPVLSDRAMDDKQQIEVLYREIMVVYPSLYIVLYIEVHHTRTSDRNIICIGQYLHIGILTQLPIDSLLCRSGKVEDMPFLLHNLEDAQLRQIALAGGKGNLFVVVKELNCFLKHRLAYHFSSSCRITPSVMGLSASVKALALYWMQSIVRFSLPVFFSARLPSGATRTMVPSLTGNISPST